MEDEFERRLREANERGGVARAESEAAKAQEIKAREEKIAKLQQTISDWQSRITLAFQEVIEKANTRISATGLRLSIEPGAALAVPPLPKLPLIRVRAHATNQPEPRHAPNVRQPKILRNEPDVQRNLPYLHISVNADGKLFVGAPKGVSVPSSIEASDLTEAKIKSIIVEFIDVLIPKSK